MPAPSEHPCASYAACFHHPEILTVSSVLHSIVACEQAYEWFGSYDWFNITTAALLANATNEPQRLL